MLADVAVGLALMAVGGMAAVLMVGLELISLYEVGRWWGGSQTDLAGVDRHVGQVGDGWARLVRGRDAERPPRPPRVRPRW